MNNLGYIKNKHLFDRKLSIHEIKEKLEKNLPGSKVEVLDPRNDGTHLKAVINYKGFKNKGLLEQHRMVYKALEDSFSKEEIHALSIETIEE